MRATKSPSRRPMRKALTGASNAMKGAADVAADASSVPEPNRLMVRAKTIVTCDTDAAQCGIDFDALGRIDDAAIVVEDGVIRAIGKASAVAAEHGFTSDGAYEA